MYIYIQFKVVCLSLLWSHWALKDLQDREGGGEQRERGLNRRRSANPWGYKQHHPFPVK